MPSVSAIGARRSTRASPLASGFWPWIADLLTVVRIPLAFLFWFVVDRPAWALAVIAAAALSDLADGRIARWARQRQGLPADEPSIGAWLDPLCDKFFVVSVLAATWVHAAPPLLLVVAIAARELVLVPLTLVYRFTPLRQRMRYDFRAGPVGKAATVAQFLAILAVLTQHPLQVTLAIVAAGLGLVAAVHYVVRGVRLVGARTSGRAVPETPGPDSSHPKSN